MEEKTGLVVAPQVSGTLAGFSDTGKTIGDLIKPLKTEIHLFDAYVSGTSKTSPEILSALSIGERLILRRVESKFDDNEIALYKGTDKIGRIPEKDNTIFARLMDAGKHLEGKITSINLVGHIYEIRMGIYLIDF